MFDTLVGVTAAGDLSDDQYKAVRMTGNGFEVTTVDDVTDVPVGILQNDPENAGDAATVAMTGVAWAEYGGSVSVGDELGAAADGQLEAKAPGTDTTHYVIAIALEDGAEGEQHLVRLVDPHRAA